MRKREAQSFYADFSIHPKPCAAPATRPRRTLKVNRLLPTLKLNSLTFLKSPKSSAHASSAWRHSHPLVIISIWDFYFDISEWHILPVCTWTPALMLNLTNPCAKRKILSLTKLKGKIYKMKSLGHYITILLMLVYLCTDLAICMCICVDTWVGVIICMCVYMYVYTYVWLWVEHRYVYMYVYICVCMGMLNMWVVINILAGNY